MHHAHAIEVDAIIALVSLIVAIVGGAAGLVWLAGMALRHWLHGQEYPRKAAGAAQGEGLNAGHGDTGGG